MAMDLYHKKQGTNIPETAHFVDFISELRSFTSNAVI